MKGAAEGDRLPLPTPVSTEGSSLRLELQGTSLVALAGRKELGHPSGRVETFGPENMELVRVVEELSAPGDLVAVQNGILGVFIYAMTRRYATRGMFHEVSPEDGGVRPEEADLAVVMVPAMAGRVSGTVPAGPLLARRGWSMVGSAGPYLVLRREVNRADSEEVDAVQPAIPMWLAYVLAALAALVVLVDALRGGSRRGKEGGGGNPHDLPPGPREYEGPGEGKALVVVPARNEEENVGGVVREVREVCPGLDVLVLADGSTDRTTVEALEAGAMVLRSEEHLGLGEMVRRGMAFALDKGYRAALRVDGDGHLLPSVAGTQGKGGSGGGFPLPGGGRLPGPDKPAPQGGDGLLPLSAPAVGAA